MGPFNKVLRVKSTTRIPISREKGRTRYVPWLPHEYILINIKTGVFRFVNKLTATSVIKYNDQEEIIMDKRLLDNFIKNIGNEFLEVDGWNNKAEFSG